MQTPTQDIFGQGVAAAQRGDLAGAEARFRECVAREPQHGLAVLNLGVVLANRGAHGEAEPILRKAVAMQPTVESVSALASFLTATKRPDEAESWYRKILKSFPTHGPSLHHLAELADRKGDRVGSRDLYKKAWESDHGNIAAGISYAIAAFADDPAETVAVMDRLLATARNDAERLKILSGLLIYKEFHERMKRGLMPYHATHIDELFFTFAAPDFDLYRRLSFEAAEQNPADIGALVRKFTAQFCSRDRRGAQETVERFRAGVNGHIWETVRFDDAFYRRLETMSDADLLAGLPPVTETLAVPFDDAPVAYLSCNQSYFASFAMPMIRSLADKRPDANLQVHLMDATDPQIADAMAFCRSLPGLRTALSVEQPWIEKQGVMAARCYYHAIRFIRLYHHLLRYGRTLWLMDVDALFNRDPQAMYDTLGDKDAAMRIRAGRFEPWNQFNACIVAATPKPASVEYFRLIAAYVAHFHQQNKLRWGIDQLAMYSVFEYLRDAGRAPSLAFLDDRAIDYDYRDDGIVWCNSGRNKFFHLNRNADGSLVVDDPDRAKYIRLFDRYYVRPT